MIVIRHRLVASVILLLGSLALVAVGRTMVQDSPAVAEIRHRLDGKWVATRVQASEHASAEGADAARTTIEFAGHAVQFRAIIEGGDARGIYVIETDANPGKIDFKLDAGWMLGTYALQGDRLTLCVNAMKLPEQLGVPTRGRPETLRPSPGRYLYEFRKVTP